MSPNYGPHRRPADELPDWLLGGNRKRRVLSALATAPSHGWTVAELVQELGCAPTTVYEILRALRPLEVLDQPQSGRLALAQHGDVAVALRSLLAALAPFEGRPVDRPPRTRGAT
jgi:hypothetical protein